MFENRIWTSSVNEGAKGNKRYSENASTRYTDLETNYRYLGCTEKVQSLKLLEYVELIPLQLSAFENPASTHPVTDGHSFADFRTTRVRLTSDARMTYQCRIASLDGTDVGIQSKPISQNLRRQFNRFSIKTA